jgi:hypothetical protein
MLKDLRLAMQLASATSSPAPMAEGVSQLYRTVSFTRRRPRRPARGRGIWGSPQSAARRGSGAPQRRAASPLQESGPRPAPPCPTSLAWPPPALSPAHPTSSTLLAPRPLRRAVAPL